MTRAVAAAVAVLCWSLFAAAETAPASLPPMQAGVAGQFTWQSVQDDAGTDEVQTFETRRFHVYFSGAPAETLDWTIGLQLTGDSISVRPYEAFINFHPDPRVNLKLGTLLPPWTLEAPKRIGKMDFVRYPLIVENNVALFSPGRQTGIMASFNPGESFSLSTGFFAGLGEADSWGNLNNMSDTLVSGRFAFLPGMSIHLGHWGGKATYSGLGTFDYSLVWAGLEIEKDAWRFTGEYVWNRGDGPGGNTASQGYQASCVYTAGRFDAVLRYEQLDPDTSDTGAAAIDDLEWTTLGLNYQLAGSVKLMGDYIFKAERSDNQSANDEILLQLSFSL